MVCVLEQAPVVSQTLVSINKRKSIKKKDRRE
jgi:hypothetical protein